MLPTLTFNDESYIFTLLRDGKSVVHILNGSSVLLEHKEANGNDLYYICFQPFQGEDIIISLTKEEFEILEPILDEIKETLYEERYECEFTRSTIKDMCANPENYGPQQLERAGYTRAGDEEYWREDYECSFCGSMMSNCGGDHGDEMREIQRQALRNDC